MKHVLSNHQTAFIRPYQEGDFQQIQELNAKEGWTNLVEENENTKKAWENSAIAYVVITEGDEVAGYIRGLTDTRITLYICELLIGKIYRGLGVGERATSICSSALPKYEN